MPINIYSSKERIQQILFNLINNAIKFTDQGYVKIKLEKVSSSHQTIDLKFTISDTGIGIDSEVISNLFEPFIQADESLSRKYGGTGLGLSICKQLVELMSGEIGVNSQPGEGSMFWFSLTVQKSKLDFVKSDLLN